MRGSSVIPVSGREASIGIGAMVVFIALVLIAGMAASVIIQTSSHLESQTMSTGKDTTNEVSTGIAVYSVEGYAATNSDISKLAIMIRPRAGTDSIDISDCFIEISNTSKKIILNYSTSYFSKPTGLDDIFSAAVFPDDNFAYGNASNRDGSRFGILVLDDADGSVTQNNPLINRGDKICLCINTTGCFNNIAERSTIWGMVIPVEGSPGVFKIQTPSTYADNVMELYYNLQ